MQCRLPGANRQRADTALKFSDARFKNSACRICDPAIAKTLNLQIKQCSAVICTVERVGYGLVYWNSYSPGCWIGLIAAVDCNRFIAHTNTGSDRCPSSCSLETLA